MNLASSGRRWTLIIVGCCTVALLVMIGALARDLIEVRTSLLATHTSLSELRNSLSDLDSSGVAAALHDANEHVASARSHSTGVLWSIAAVLPLAATPVGVVRNLVEAADASVETATTLASDGVELFESSAAFEMRDGRIDLTPIATGRDLLEQVDLERLAAARNALETPVRGWIPTTLADARADALVLLDEVVTLLERARTVADVMPSFLGEDGARRYLVGMQTPAELRGTGGLIGYWAVLKVDDGAVSLDGSAVNDPTDEPEEFDEPDGETGTTRIGALSGPGDAASAADRAFHARYDHVNATRRFSTINVDPDLPTTAAVMLELYRVRTGEQLDGLVLIDPLTVQRMLVVAADALPLPDDLSDIFGDQLPTRRFARLVTVDIYETLGVGHNTRRKAALQRVGDEAMQLLFSGGWDATELIGALADSASERRLQVFSRDAVEQAGFVALGVAGELDTPADGDLIAVSANNAVGGKQDVHLGHTFDLRVRLGELDAVEGATAMKRHASLRITVENPLPTHGMDLYVIGNCVVEGHDDRCFDGPAGTNRTWFSTWLPADSELVAATSNDGTQPWFTDTYREMFVVDQYLTTPSQETGWLDYQVTGSVTTTDGPNGQPVYELLWRRQPKAIPDLLDVRIEAPDGWRITQIETEGGGDGRGTGVHGDGVPLVTEIGPSGGWLRGTVTADLRVRVNLVADVG